jgi:hypothetical protein
VPGATNGIAQIFLYDSQTETTALVTADRSGNGAGDSPSNFPLFSANGQILLFQSSASDLTALDFNSASDIFFASLMISPLPWFNAQIQASSIPGQPPTISFTLPAGLACHAQYTDDLAAPNWQDLNVTIGVSGTQGSFTDPAPAGGQRYYRLVAY